MHDRPLETLRRVERGQLHGVAHRTHAVVVAQGGDELVDARLGFEDEMVARDLEEGLDGGDPFGVEIEPVGAGPLVGQRRGKSLRAGPPVEQVDDLGTSQQRGLPLRPRGDPGGLECAAERRQLRVRPRQDGLVMPGGPGPATGPHGPGHDGGFLVETGHGDGGWVAARACRRLGLTPDHPGRRGQDLRCRPEVGAQTDDRDPRQVVLDPEQEVGLGPVPAVDGLVGITDHDQRRLRPPQRVEECELERVHVLELVDEEVAVAPPLRVGEARLASEGLVAQRQHVVEVDRAPLPLQGLVLGVRLRHEGCAARWSAPGVGRSFAVCLRGDQAGPGPPDLAVEIGDRGAIEPRVRGGEQRGPSGEERGVAAAGVIPVAAQDGERRCVERTGGDLLP
ncbi:MAG: hypothetical protein R2695_01270 [Acidimicrobiales bacterium]